jgi:hypothetical protein
MSLLVEHGTDVAATEEKKIGSIDRPSLTTGVYWVNQDLYGLGPGDMPSFLSIVAITSLGVFLTPRCCSQFSIIALVGAVVGSVGSYFPPSDTGRQNSPT